MLGRYRHLITTIVVLIAVLVPLISYQPWNAVGTAKTSAQLNQAAAVELAAIPEDAPLTLVTEPDDGVQPVLDAIAHASKSVDLVIYELEDPEVEQALVDASAHGVAVRVLMQDVNTYGTHPNQKAYDFLKSHNVLVKWAPGYFSLTHQKTLVTDAGESDQSALIMTFNLSPKYYDSSRDFGVRDTDPQDVQAIESAFNSDWDGTQQIAPNGRDLVWSPGSSATLLNLIQSASSTLEIYNEEMADPRITQALEQAAARGVDVRVTMTYATNWKPDFNELTQAGVNVRTYASSASRYIHAKMVIADTSRAFLGSENFSGQSLDSNRELGILISRPDILASLEKTFDSDWTAARVYTVKQ